ncbi:MAG: DHA2 family efflux MFS transporter permease subunit [Verrucomicrobia bacterium]|nr:DHA2 family efflux MFS transporter permease subunit [Verrucomicrobiota bacterium]
MSEGPPQLEHEEWRPRFNPWLIAVAVMMATFMEVLDTSVANVALPHIAGNLSVTTDEATWVLTSYLVSNAIILPITGWLANYFGRKRLLMICVGLFTGASILCGLAPSLGFLVVARILQGAGGGAMLPISQAVLLESFPPHKRGVAMAVFAMGVVVAPILGPTLGGWITDNYSWRWIFYINLPVGIAAVLMAQLVVEDPPYIRRSRAARVDFVGFSLLAVWLATLQVILDKGQQADWFDARWVCWFAAISTASFLGFVIWERRVTHPIVDLHILGNRNFSIGILLMTLLGGVLYGTTAALPIFLQTLMGYPALQSGYALSPRGIGAFITTSLVGRLVGRVRNRFLLTVGFTLLAVSSFLLAHINLDVGMAQVIWPSVLNGVAVSFIFVPLTTTTMGHLRQAQMGNATGIFNLMRNLGGSVGIAAVTTYLARSAQVHQALMVPHLTPFDPVFRERVAALSTSLAATSGTVLGGQQAIQIIYNLLDHQAHMWAFVDNFRLFGFLCLGCVPLVFLFKRVTPARGQVAAH